MTLDILNPIDGEYNPDDWGQGSNRTIINPQSPNHELIVSLDGFEGPIDLLLSLCRDHKIDLVKIQILPLAEQYCAYIGQAQRLNLDIAADYLVMAAWLGFLKSQLLLPKEEQDAQEIPPEALAENLAHRLLQLQAMQKAAQLLQDRPRLNRNFFLRQSEESLGGIDTPIYEFSLYALLTDYGKIYASHKRSGPLHIAPTSLQSMEFALERLKLLVGAVPAWCDLMQFMPNFADEKDILVRKSHLAANFAACLELARAHQLELKQDHAFAPLYIRKAIADDAENSAATQREIYHA